MNDSVMCSPNIEEFSNTMKAATMMKLRGYLKIAHHIPGRIRLKIKPGLLADPEALKLAGSVKFDRFGAGAKAIINTRFNGGAGSLVIDYDPEQASPGLITELFSSPDADRVEQLVGQLADQLGLTV